EGRSVIVVVFFVFFFQAEDGIRDRTVTGVQTCALPISRKLAILVSQLLDLPRIEAGRLHLDRRNADLVELVSGIVEMKQAETNRHRIVCRSAGPCEAMFDWGRMEQVLASLLDNTVKFSPLGGEITVDAQRNDSQ